MNLIRAFLWTLAGVMMLQGVMQADEYGSAASFIGGMSLTMSVWKEDARSWLWLAQRIVPLPRVIVQSALRETALHPGIHAVPQLQATLKGHQRTWNAFREEELKWLLDHADLVGAIQSEPAARELWTHWLSLLNYSETALVKAQAETCSVRAISPSACDRAANDVRRYRDQSAVAAEAVKQWDLVLTMRRWLSVREWWEATQNTQVSSSYVNLSISLAHLHDTARTNDPRLQSIMAEIPNIAATMANKENPWLRRLLTSLLVGEVWTACLEHVRLREGRVRELMVVAGVQDLINAHERILNASLRAVATTDQRKVQDWFGEMSGYGWWMADEIPNLVRRCVGQEAGDCTRVGQAEIVALTERFVERSQIVRDWNRRILIGMWNAIPIIGILFVLELILLCLTARLGSSKTVLLGVDETRLIHT